MHRGTVGSCVPRFARVEFRNACRQAPPASLELRGSLRRERGSTSLVVCRLGGGALVGSFAGHSWGSRLGGAVLGESSWKGPQAVRSSWGSRLGGVVLEVVVCKIPMGPNESLWNPIDPYGIYHLYITTVTATTSATTTATTTQPQTTTPHAVAANPYRW